MNVEFIIENAVLIVLALGSGIALLWPTLTNGGAAAVPSISATEAVMLMNQSKTIVLDVRDEAEFAAGHIQGAKHIPVKELEGRIKELEKHKKKPVLVYCQHGVRSNAACKTIAGHAFEQACQLKGGLDKWIEAKMPIVKD
jgi:rhodanese-related sulfurtransferase